MFGPPGTYSWCRQLGARVAVLGPDCRAERTVHRILSPETYEALFAQYVPSTLMHGWHGERLSACTLRSKGWPCSPRQTLKPGLPRPFNTLPCF